MLTESGVPVSHFIIEEVINEFGQKVKIYKPHPVYKEMQTMKQMIDSFDCSKKLQNIREERQASSLFLAAETGDFMA